MQGKTGYKGERVCFSHTLIIIIILFTGVNITNCNFYTGWKGGVWHARNQRRQGMTSPHTLDVEFESLCLWYNSFQLSVLCEMLQGPEGPVGVRGLRGLQVSNIYSFILDCDHVMMLMCFILTCDFYSMFFIIGNIRCTAVTFIIVNSWNKYR